MLGRLLLLSGAAGALRAPGRSGSLPKKPLRGGRSVDTAELFVANLPDSDRDDFLKFARSAFPAVRRVTVPRDRSTGAARGFVATRVHFFVSMVSRSAAAPAQQLAAQAFVEVPRDDVPAAVAALDGAVLGSKRLKARPADERATAAPDRSDRSSFAVNQRLAACATGLDVARECAAQTKGGAPLSGVNVATALQRIAKLEARRTKRDDRVDKAFRVLAKEAARQAQDGAPRELANILWALAKFKLTEAAMPEVFDALSQACAAKAPAFNAQDVSNTAWAWATAGATSNPAGWDAIAAHAPSKIESFDQRALSLTAWAFATAGVAAPQLFEAIAQAAPARMARDEFDAQGYANTAWAFATAGYTSSSTGGVSPSSPLFDAIAEYAPTHMDEFKPQELSATAWACGKHGCSLRLYDSIAAAAPRRISEFSPQGLVYDRCDPANRPFRKTHNITQDFGGSASPVHAHTGEHGLGLRDGRRPGARALRVDRRGRAADHLPVQFPVAGDAGVELRARIGRRA